VTSTVSACSASLAGAAVSEPVLFPLVLLSSEVLELPHAAKANTNIIINKSVVNLFMATLSLILNFLRQQGKYSQNMYLSSHKTHFFQRAPSMIMIIINARSIIATCWLKINNQ